jgi:type II secretory pathway pseudopilin PulG
MRRLQRGRGRRYGRGIVLLAFLLALALAGLGAMVTLETWSVTRQHEREQQLLFVGHQYRAAIRSYYLAGPGAGGARFPSSLQELLDDDRYPVPVHHLRRLYPDPITGSTDWGLLMVGDRIMGVYSKSEAPPLKRKGFAPADVTFEDKDSYQSWIFAFVPGRRSAASPVSPASSPSATPQAPSSRSTR